MSESKWAKWEMGGVPILPLVVEDMQRVMGQAILKPGTFFGLGTVINTRPDDAPDFVAITREVLEAIYDDELKHT